MTFRFPLQRLLDLKAKREQEMARQLAAARTDAEGAETLRDTIAGLKAAGADQVAHGVDSALSVGELVSMREALTQMDARLEVAEEAAVAANEVVQARNADLHGAVRDRQVLDRLRDRRLEQHKANENQLDRAAMDAVALSRFNAARSGEHDSTSEKP